MYTFRCLVELCMFVAVKKNGTVKLISLSGQLLYPVESEREPNNSHLDLRDPSQPQK